MVTGWGRECERAWHRSSLISHGLQMSWERSRGCHGMLWESQWISKCVSQEEATMWGEWISHQMLWGRPPKIVGQVKTELSFKGLNMGGAEQLSLQKLSLLTLVHSERIPTSYSCWVTSTDQSRKWHLKWRACRERPEIRHHFPSTMRCHKISLCHQWRSKEEGEGGRNLEIQVSQNTSSLP